MKKDNFMEGKFDKLKEGQEMKTIGRNQAKKAALIFANAKNIKSYTLGNCFTGEDCDKMDYKGDNWLWQDWERFNFARLTKGNPGKYTLKFHSNHWVSFEADIG
ncbi:hypothetical protein [Candidatus Oleimmundimicrobium sp.]|uniref:hypothetical protein n=1 Tax=Candidatus Oleimmundimicrobium sp. TaxID=3060597 RepID=UPI00272122A3|nr:hypothetical protein [Candidatus Oleimmundimicrobium sp.]MDO8885739.1 hypothetical protein [Candidatus Oleimmundimicrobium sp.]